MKILKIACIAALMAILCACWFQRFTPVSLDQKRPLLIQSEIKGEVLNPGIYSLKNGATVADLIEEAGGVNENGSTDALNLLQELRQGEVVVVGENEQAKGESLISINSATIEELQTLPGIGPALAGRIVEYRKEHPFQSLEELKDVKGIGDKMFEKVKDRLVL